MNLQRSLNMMRSPVIYKCFRVNPIKIRNLGACNALFSAQRNTRDVSTYEATSEIQRESLLKRMLGKININFNKSKLAVSAYLLYEGIVDNINYLDFFNKFNLPDTFYSWFVITELHIWLLSARVMAEGEDGRCLRNSLVEALWSDVQQRTKKLGVVNPAGIRSQISELSEQLQAALLAYDEGNLCDDVVLAAALWRRIYQYGPFEPKKLEELVKYVREQMCYLDNLPKERILFKRDVEWKPLRVNS